MKHQQNQIQDSGNHSTVVEKKRKIRIRKCKDRLKDLWNQQGHQYSQESQKEKGRQKAYLTK